MLLCCWTASASCSACEEGSMQGPSSIDGEADACLVTWTSAVPLKSEDVRLHGSTGEAVSSGVVCSGGSCMSNKDSVTGATAPPSATTSLSEAARLEPCSTIMASSMFSPWYGDVPTARANSSEAAPMGAVHGCIDKSGIAPCSSEKQSLEVLDGDGCDKCGLLTHGHSQAWTCHTS